MAFLACIESILYRQLALMHFLTYSSNDFIPVPNLFVLYRQLDLLLLYTIVFSDVPVI